MRAALGCSLAAAALAVLPAAAQGSNVSLENGVITFAAGAGEANEVYVGLVGDVYRVVDSGQNGHVTATAPCTAETTEFDPEEGTRSSYANCPASGVERFSATLGDGDDSLGETSGLPVIADGGEGHDLLTGTGGVDRFTGGPGNDLLAGKDGDDALDGGAGRDNLYGGAGGDALSGGPSEDAVYGDREGVDDDDSPAPGDDVIEVRDGYRDDVVCAGGGDEVRADWVDPAGIDCERFRRADTDPPGSVRAVPARRSIRMTRSRRHPFVHIPMRCEPAGEPCSGYLTFFGRRPPRPNTIERYFNEDLAGAAPFTVPAGGRGRATEDISGEHARALSRRRRETWWLAVLTVDSAGRTLTLTAGRITVRAPRSGYWAPRRRGR